MNTDIALGIALDSVPLEAKKKLQSDLNFKSYEIYGIAFCELESDAALPIAEEMAQVWKDGLSEDSVTLAQLQREGR